VKDVVNNSGTVINHMVYDAFGNVVSQTNSTVETRYRFTGREFDAESQLYYYRARYYDAGSGTFISEDPIGFLSGDLNPYRYVGANPVRFRDPEGLEPNINVLPAGDASTVSGLPHSFVIPIVDVALGTFTFAGHGNEAGDAVVIVENGIRRELTAKEVADRIRKDKDYRKGQAVKLFVCNAGKKLAQEVATELGANVTGPTTPITAISGNTSPVLDPGGRWATFTP
jgi:RHS repeat-associated protein